MKIRITFILIVIYIPFLLNSQLQKTSKGWDFNTIDKYLSYKEEKKIKDDVIEQLKKTKTVFFMKYNKSKKDSLMIDSFLTAFKLGWDLSEIVIDDVKNMDKYFDDPNISYIIVEGKYTQGGNAAHAGGYYLTLTVNDLNDKGTKTKAKVLCRIDLFPDANFSEITTANSGFSLKEYDDQLVLDDVYNGIKKRWVLNFSPVYLMAHLCAVSTNIKAKIRPDHDADYKDEKLQDLLATETLYVSKRLLKGYKGFKAEEYDLDEEVFEDYKYKYKVCSDAELYKIFIKEKKGRLIFEYVKKGTSKYIKIIDVQSKKYIYKFHGSGMKSPVLNSKDFKRLCD